MQLLKENLVTLIAVYRIPTFCESCIFIRANLPLNVETRWFSSYLVHDTFSDDNGGYVFKGVTVDVNLTMPGSLQKVLIH